MVRNSRSTSSLDAASTMKTKARSPTGSPPARIFLSPSNFTRVSNVGRMMFSKTSAVSIGEANPGPSDPRTRYFLLLLPSLLLRVINVACTLKSPRPYCKPKESLPLRSNCELCAHQRGSRELFLAGARSIEPGLLTEPPGVFIPVTNQTRIGAFLLPEALGHLHIGNVVDLVSPCLEEQTM